MLIALRMLYFFHLILTDLSLYEVTLCMVILENMYSKLPITSKLKVVLLHFFSAFCMTLKKHLVCF